MPENTAAQVTGRTGRKALTVSVPDKAPEQQTVSDRGPQIFEEPEPEREYPLCWFFTRLNEKTKQAEAMECRVPGQFLENDKDGDDPGMEITLCAMCIQAKTLLVNAKLDPFWETRRAPD